MAWDAIVIGAGCAGLAAATRLAESGQKVLVLEKRSLLGGRASSFQDRESGETLDNGQHLFLGCYKDTKTYLQRIGTLDQLRFQNSFQTPMVGPSGETAWLKTAALPAPWNLAVGLASYRALSVSERFNTFRVAKAIRSRKGNGLHRMTVDEWLRSLHQGPRARARLWDLLTLATLNIDPKRAPADLLAVVLKEGFMTSRSASAVGLSSVGLSELHGEPSKRYIESRGGEVRLRTSVMNLERDGDRCTGVRLADGSVENARVVISAVPPPALRKLVEKNAPQLEAHVAATSALTASPILSVHAWFDRQPFEAPYLGLWDTNYHWAFRKDAIFDRGKARHVSMVTSAANHLASKPKDELIDLARRELKPVSGATKMERAVVVWEHEATWVPPVGDSTCRLSPETPISNFFLAGDWTATGLPATIEGAVRSGHRAFDAAIRVIQE